MYPALIIPDDEMNIYGEIILLKEHFLISKLCYSFRNDCDYICSHDSLNFFFFFISLLYCPIFFFLNWLSILHPEQWFPIANLVL